MQPLRRLILLVALAPVGAAVALAASLTLNGDAIGAASISTPRCTTAGLAIVENLTVSNVVSATVTNIPASCANATIQVTVNNLVTSSGGSATVPAGGGSVTVTLAAPVALAAVNAVDLVMTGP
jgi:hypothetical protein